jgi:hypothetical protein
MPKGELEPLRKQEWGIHGNAPVLPLTGLSMYWFPPFGAERPRLERLVFNRGLIKGSGLFA